MTETAPNYTDEMVAKMLSAYEHSDKSKAAVEAIAATLNKPYKSVVAKLSREGVYKKPMKAAAPAYRDDGPTKGEMLTELTNLGFENADGLKGATKAALAAVIALLRGDDGAEDDTDGEDDTTTDPTPDPTPDPDVDAE